MKEQLFIDMVDHEWCWRMQQYGYQLFQSNSAILPHQVGSKTIKVFGVPFLISAPNRYFFQYRNILWLCKLPYMPTSWKLKTIVRRLFELFFVPWWTNRPLQTLQYILKGINVGLKTNL
jgi:rhamnosyltransferase